MTGAGAALSPLVLPHGSRVADHLGVGTETLVSRIAVPEPMRGTPQRAATVRFKVGMKEVNLRRF